MKTNRQKIEKEIRNSDLSRKDQEEFLVFLFFLSDEELEPMAELFSQDKSWVSRIYQNIKSKYSALVSRDQRLWKKIIQEEIDLLKKTGE
jgi:hypothetical protein